MKLREHTAFFAFLGWLWSGIWSSAAQPQPVAEVNLDAFTTSQVRDASPAFLSDDLISLLVRGPLGTSDSSVIALRLAEGKLQMAGMANGSSSADKLLAVSGQRILVWSRRAATLYSRDLRTQWTVPVRERLLSSSFPGSGIIGERDLNRWAVIQLSPEMPIIREGSGQLLSVSDEVIILRRDDTVRIESHNGRLLGSIQVPSDTKGAPIAEVAGLGRLFLTFGRSYRIVDFGGNDVTRISPQPGWGFRRGWSSDGRRVLFDQNTRKASVLERAVDSLASVLVPVPEESDGETITVIDTSTGKVCFRLDGDRSVFGNAGLMHADISPSGRLVGVATRTKLSLYNLPETCSGN